MNGDLTAASKFLSYVLRHNPAAIGAELDENGWITIETLLAAALHNVTTDFSVKGPMAIKSLSTTRTPGCLTANRLQWRISPNCALVCGDPPQPRSPRLTAAIYAAYVAVRMA